MLILIIFGTLLFGYARLVEPFWLAAKEVNIQSDKLTSPDGSITIGLFGDTHFGFDYDLGDFTKVISAFNERKPDIVIFSGDLIDDINGYTGDFSLISEALSKIEAPLGKYAVYGNHDYSSDGTPIYEEIMAAGGFNVLVNQTFDFFEHNIKIYGIDDCLIGYGNPQILFDADNLTYNLVICHEPDIMDQISEYPVSLMLSGHTHGGQVNIPGYTKKYLPGYGEKYIRGLFNIDNDYNSFLYVTTGIGTTKLPMRFMARPEVSFVKIDM